MDKIATSVKGSTVKPFPLWMIANLLRMAVGYCFFVVSAACNENAQRSCAGEKYERPLQKPWSPISVQMFFRESSESRMSAPTSFTSFLHGPPRRWFFYILFWEPVMKQLVAKRWLSCSLVFFPSNARWLLPARLSSRKDNCIVQIHRINAVAHCS